jgi:hypothetical protein
MTMNRFNLIIWPVVDLVMIMNKERKNEVKIIF